jgi:hypothetical protein
MERYYHMVFNMTFGVRFIRILTTLLRRSAFMAAICISLPAHGMEDPVSGLKINLGSGFVIKRDSAKDPVYDVLFGIDPASGQPPPVGTSSYLCGVTFRSDPQNVGFTQPQINAIILDEKWSVQARRSLSASIELETASAFEIDDISGVEFIGVPKTGPDHANVRLMMSMLETPKGRTTVTCATTKASFNDVMPMFHRIRDAISPPR